MHLDTQDTIVALASPPTGAARGIVRLSGADAVSLAVKLLPDGPEAAGSVSLLSVKSPQRMPCTIQFRPAGAARPLSLPAALFMWPGRRSFTRQPVVEVHTLGSPPLLQAVVEELVRFGARIAERGEFTLRAFLAGRIDLTQAEAVLGVIDAAGDQELSAALSQLAGGLSTPLHALRDVLLSLLAELEAGLDFVDEDIEFISPGQLQRQLEEARIVVGETLEQLASRRQASALPRVVLVGPPNAGKSSLFNRLVEELDGADATAERRSSALVSPIAGTTRDYVTANVSIGGIEVELVDTAGEMTAEFDSIEGMAQSSASQLRGEATLRLRCIDGTAPEYGRAEGDAPSDCEVAVVTKADLLDADDVASLAATSNPLAVSSLTGQGVPEVVERLQRAVASLNPEHGPACVAATAVRCAGSLREATEALQRAGELAAAAAGDELTAAEVRHALSSLGAVVGAVYTDDVLDRIFSQFCIGK